MMPPTVLAPERQLTETLLRHWNVPGPRYTAYPTADRFVDAFTALPKYNDAIRQGPFPLVRGMTLTRDDLARRAVIMVLICQGRVECESTALSHWIDMQRYFETELAQMQDMQALVPRLRNNET